jgi:signal transduction histidine kinase
MIADEFVGALAFASRTRDRFADDEIQFIRTISDYVAVALERLRKETELRATKDDLEIQVQKRTEKLRDTVQEMEGFTYSITHDMRAPLRAMQGFAQILLDEYQKKLDEEGVEHLQRIANAARRLDSLITDVLNYAKIVRAETPLHPVDLDKLLRDIIREYPTFHQSKAEICIPEALPPVLGNEAFLTQILSNLLDNAVKFVAPGTVPRVTISAEKDEQFVRISVEDNGVGIDPQHQGRIFNLFERLHTPQKYSGTGVGLAIVRKAVQRLGGHAGVESGIGKGSRFWIKLTAA